MHSAAYADTALMTFAVFLVFKSAFAGVRSIR